MIVENLPNEEWVFIPNFENEYMISNYGRVKSCDRYIVDSIGRTRFYEGNIKPLYKNPNGYLMTGISRKHKTINIYPHVLVCTLFNGKKPNNNYIVNHKDLNKLNNYFENLEWVTYSENNIHSYKNKNKKSLGGPGLAEEMIVIKNNEITYCSSMKEVSRIFGISITQAWRIVDTEKLYHKELKIYRKSNYNILIK